MISDKTYSLIEIYNASIDLLISEISKLKLPQKQTDDLSVRELQQINTKWGILTSTKRRKQIEYEFSKIYDEYTYEFELERNARGL